MACTIARVMMGIVEKIVIDYHMADVILSTKKGEG